MKRTYLLLISIVIASLMVVTTFSVMASTISSETASISSNEASSGMKTHKLTSDEVSKLKKFIGVREQGKNYNKMVDGHGTGLAPPSNEEWNSMADNITVLDNMGSSSNELTGSYDLSTSVYFPPVGNQGTQGSCAAWAAIYYSFGYLEAKDNGWSDAHLGSPNHLLSPAWTYNKLDSGIKGHGSSIANNYQIASGWGVATMATMPYSDGDWTSYGSTAAFREAPLHRSGNPNYISYQDPSTITTIKEMISSGTPVNFAIDGNAIDSCFYSPYWPIFENYIVSSAEYSPSGVNHAQTIVGYNDTISDDGEIGAFKVVNSWGTGWGNSGYYWITYKAFMEICGIFPIINYVADLPDYVPKMLAVWQFDSAPSRTAACTNSFQLGLGTYALPITKKSSSLSIDSTNLLPRYMCLDISEFSTSYEQGYDTFYIHLGPSSIKGTLSSFKIERYEDGYNVGTPTQVSGQASGLKMINPGSVSNTFPNHSTISISEALDGPSYLPFISSGFSAWTPVNQQNAFDGDSLQSGNTENGANSSILTYVSGPAMIQFTWRVSSEANWDCLKFYLDGQPMSTISGSIDWTEMNYSLSAGGHSLQWIYSKDISTSDYEDCGWIDHLIVDSTSPVTSAIISGTTGVNGWYTSDIQVTLSAVDDGLGVNSTYYGIDSGIWTKYVGPFSITTEGQHTVHYYSLDNAGNAEPVRNSTMNIYRNSLICTITAPTNKSTYCTNWGWIKMMGTASDDKVVTSVTWSNSLGGSGIAYGTTSWQSRGNIQLFLGVNLIIVTAYDSDGFTATDNLTVTYEKILPTCTITSPTSSPTHATKSATINLDGTASDASGIATVKWKNMATGGSGTATGTTSWNIAGTALNVGMNLIYVNATDNAGNKMSDAIWVTRIADTPVATITVPTDSPTMTTGWHMINLRGTATDETSVALVTWVNSLGGSGIAYMTPQSGGASVTWQSRGNVNLSPGDNVITVTATDSNGNTATDVLTVTYTGY